MRTRFPCAWRATLLASSLAGCVDATHGASPPSLSSVAFVVDVQAAPTRAGYVTQQFELRVQPFVARSDGSTTPLGERRLIALGSAPAQRASFVVAFDPRDCAANATSATGVAACPLRLDASLVLSNGGLVLDHQLLGPWIVASGSATARDTVRLIEVGAPEVFPRSPTLAIGATLRMHAQLVTIRGDTVARPVTWRSETPTIAVVDDSGVVTGRAAGTANIMAIFGNGQSSNGQAVTVRVP